MEDLYSIFSGVDTIPLFPPHLWDTEALRPYPKLDNSDLDNQQQKLEIEKNMVLSDRRLRDA